MHKILQKVKIIYTTVEKISVSGELRCLGIISDICVLLIIVYVEHRHALISYPSNTHQYLP